MKMKAFVVCATLLVSAIQAEVPSGLVHAALRAKWSSFKAEHKKAYSADEENLRMANYLDNTQLIEQHNARFHQGLETYELGHNELSDLTLEEIKSTRMGSILPPNDDEIASNSSLHFAPSGVAAPAEVDWRSKNCVQRVKHQGKCGSCYTFAAVAAIETAYCSKRNGELPNLSEQHLVDCAGRGCNGGWAGNMFTYLKENGGAVSQGDYAYTGRQQSCQQGRKRKIVQVAGFKQIARGNEDDMMQAIATVGALAVSYNAEGPKHAFYKGGILDDPTCERKGGHAVVVVGYGTENGQPFWILKNSWGERWGENGYFRMARGKNMCGVAIRAIYPTAV